MSHIIKDILFSKVTLVVIIVLLVFFGARKLRSLAQERDQYKRNTSELYNYLQGATKEVTEIKISRREYQNFMTQREDSLLRELGKKPRHVVQHHYIKGETDTVLVQVPIIREETSIIGEVNKKGVWIKAQAYLTTDSMDISYKISPELDIFVTRERPKNWFIRLKWNSRNWETRGRVIFSAPEGIEIKENLKISVE